MRNLAAPMIQNLTANTVYLAYLLDITFSSGPAYVWSGLGSLTFDGDTYQGVGSLGQIGQITETNEVRANGTTVQLSGIDSTLREDCLSDIQIGAPVTLYLATLDPIAKSITATYTIFAGTVDKPVHRTSPDSLTIALSLENKLYNMQRANCRRYTSADQRIYYSDDISMSWIEMLNNASFVWGS